MHIPLKMKREIPIINTNFSQIYKTLKTLIKMSKSDLYIKGVLSRRFVEKWHNPNKIAQRVINDIEEII